MEDRAHIRVMNAVRRALVESPDLENSELYDRVAARYAWVTQLSAQQFYGRFVRRARREVGVKAPARRATAAKPAAGNKPRTPKTPNVPKTPKIGVSNQDRKAISSARPKAPRAARAPARSRGRVRELFVGFAQDVAGARSDPEIIEAIRRVDSYVDRVLRACGTT